MAQAWEVLWPPTFLCRPQGEDETLSWLCLAPAPAHTGHQLSFLEPPDHLVGPFSVFVWKPREKPAEERGEQNGQLLSASTDPPAESVGAQSCHHPSSGPGSATHKGGLSVQAGPGGTAGFVKPLLSEVAQSLNSRKEAPLGRCP